jgi:hypothetical protein
MCSARPHSLSSVLPCAAPPGLGRCTLRPGRSSGRRKISWALSVISRTTTRSTTGASTSGGAAARAVRPRREANSEPPSAAVFRKKPRLFNRGMCSSLSIFCKPAFTTQASRRSTPARSERTGEAGAEVAVTVEVFRVIGATMELGELCARRAGVVVVLGVVEEVLAASEEATFGSARRQGLAHDRHMPWVRAGCGRTPG